MSLVTLTSFLSTTITWSNSSFQLVQSCRSWTSNTQANKRCTIRSWCRCWFWRWGLKWSWSSRIRTQSSSPSPSTTRLQWSKLTTWLPSWLTRICFTRDSAFLSRDGKLLTSSTQREEQMKCHHHKRGSSAVLPWWSNCSRTRAREKWELCLVRAGMRSWPRRQNCCSGLQRLLWMEGREACPQRVRWTLYPVLPKLKRKGSELQVTPFLGIPKWSQLLNPQMLD